MARRPLRELVSLPWLALSICMIALIWGNSLVPGTGSSSISLMVVDAVRSALATLGLPNGWVTNFLMRKAAHFTEYAVLGVLVSQALDPLHRPGRFQILAASVACVLVPSIDESIQLCVAGRSGQVTDVLLDCCGAATGILLRSLSVRALGPSHADRRR